MYSTVSFHCCYCHNWASSWAAQKKEEWTNEIKLNRLCITSCNWSILIQIQIQIEFVFWGIRASKKIDAAKHSISIYSHLHRHSGGTFKIYWNCHRTIRNEFEEMEKNGDFPFGFFFYLNRRSNSGISFLKVSTFKWDSFVRGDFFLILLVINNKFQLRNVMLLNIYF